MTYHDAQGREIEDLEWDNMKKDRDQDNPLRRLKSKFESTCPDCDAPIHKGAQIWYNVVTKKATHFFCPIQGAR